MTAVLEVGSQPQPESSRLTAERVNLSSHLWVGSGYSGSSGTIILTNGGTLNMLAPGGNGMLGLGTVNASSASGGKGFCMSMTAVCSTCTIFRIRWAASIQPGSVLDISGSGVVTIPGDRIAMMSAYTNAGKITAYGGTGTVGIDYNNTNVGKTTLWAIGGYAPPTDASWIATSGTGLWSEGANWTGGGGFLRPA